MRRRVIAVGILLGTIICVAVIAVLALFVLPNLNLAGSINDRPGEIDNSNLATVDGDTYTMYYPSYYEDYDSPGQEVSFISSENNRLGGGNNIGIVVTHLGVAGSKANETECKDLADTISKTALSIVGGKAEVEEVEVLVGESHYGCRSKLTGEYDGLGFIMENRTVYLKDEEDALAHAVYIFYDENTEASEVKDLQDSMKAFELK